MTNQTIRVLSREDVKKALSLKEAIALMKEAFVQLSSGLAVVPVRMNLEVPKEKGRVLFMPAYLEENRKIGVKIVSIMDENPPNGLPLIHAMIVVLDSVTGQPLALMDGEYLTALRTGAASGLATDLLARSDARVAAIFGAGVQGRAQLEAVCAVRTIERAFVFDVDPSKAVRFAREMQKKLAITIEVQNELDLLKHADIICTATTATTPVFWHQHLRPGVHINGIGAYRPDMAEIPVETVQQAKVIVDHRPSCLREAGDLLQPLQAGLIDTDHVYAEIGEIAAGTKPGRTSDTEITFFKSVGNAVQDLAAASQALVNAEKLSLGTEVSP